MRVLTEADAIALSQFAEYLARWHKATAALAKYGDVIPVKDASGAVIGLKRSPWVGLQLDYGLMIRRYAQEFGMTPSARSRLTGENGQAEATTFSRAKALAWNVVSSLTAVLGGLVGWWALRDAMALLPYALAVAAASLLYVAVADLIPGLHKRTDLRASAWQLLWIGVGIGLVMVAESQLH